MTEVHYEWAPGQAYPRIQQHSVAKHEILRAYLTAYIRTLTSNPNREEFRLALIDGFAGGGVYQHAHNGKELLGSPFIMLDAAKEAEFMINKDRHKPIMLNLDYFFIERDRGAALHLERELNGRGYRHQIGNNIFLHNSSFEDRADLHRACQKTQPSRCQVDFLIGTVRLFSGACSHHPKNHSSTAW